jgi:hypothetical protein
VVFLRGALESFLESPVVTKVTHKHRANETEEPVK